MSEKAFHTWTYSLTSTLVVMVPFDLLASLAMDVYLPAVPQMPSALATSPFIIQLTLSLYILILGIGQLIFGPLSDKIGRRPVVLGGTTMFAATSFLMAIVDNGETFLALRIFQALGASAALVGTFATVRDVFANTPRSATIYGLFSAMLAFVPAIGPILGAAIIMIFSWRAIFTMLGVMATISLLHAWLRWRETLPERTQNHDPAMSSILGNRNFRVYTIGFAAAMGTFFVFVSTAPRVLIVQSQWDQLSFSLAFSSVALVMIVTTRFIEKFVQRWGIQGCFIRGTCIMSAGATVLGCLYAITDANFFSFVMPMWFIAIGIVFVVSVTANGALADFEHAAGTAVAMYYGIQSLIVSGVGTLFVFIFNGDTAWPLVIYCFFMSAACMINSRTLKKKIFNIK